MAGEQQDRAKEARKIFQKAYSWDEKDGVEKIETCRLPRMLEKLGITVSKETLDEYIARLDPMRTEFIDRTGYDEICNSLILNEKKGAAETGVSIG